MRTSIALALLCVQACTGWLTASASDKLPVKIYLMAGQSNMVGPGNKTHIELNHPELMKPRDDVYCAYAGKITGPLQPGYGGREYRYGLELTMGKVLGDAIENPILLVKSCIEWHHVLMCYDGSAKSLNIYVDGTPTDPKRAKSSTDQIDKATHIIPAPKGVPLTLGGLIERAGQFQVFDELAIWSRPLTLQDARTLYNNGHGVEIRANSPSHKTMR